MNADASALGMSQELIGNTVVVYVEGLCVQHVFIRWTS